MVFIAFSATPKVAPAVTYIKGNSSLRAGFEPARENPIGFQVQRLNHSAIAAVGGNM